MLVGWGQTVGWYTFLGGLPPDDQLAVVNALLIGLGRILLAARLAERATEAGSGSGDAIARLLREATAALSDVDRRLVAHGVVTPATNGAGAPRSEGLAGLAAAARDLLTALHDGADVSQLLRQLRQIAASIPAA